MLTQSRSSRRCCWLESISPEQGVAVAADDQHRPVLALRRVLLECDPGPDDLAGIGVAVRLGGVLELPGALLGWVGWESVPGECRTAPRALWCGELRP